MGFIGVMLAVFCGIWIYNISHAIITVAIDSIKNHEKTSKKIGFGDDDGSQKKTKGATMRKIGFGEND